MNPNFANELSQLSKLYDQRMMRLLDQYLPSNEAPQSFFQSLRYVMTQGGKRLRPILVYLGGQLVGSSIEVCDAPALAVELIHTYSLVHDDLPAMDNDDLRRGQPSCHIAFDEATAILTGDALQTLAFEVLADHAFLSPAKRIQMIRCLAKASGLHGMCKGQALDISATNSILSVDELKTMHQCKTGALIKASLVLGALTQEHLSQDLLKSLESYADHLGLAFQVQDDILDVIGSTDTLGKPQGSDASKGKVTYVSMLGLDEAKKLANELCEKAKAALSKFDYNKPLCHLADYVVNRAL